MSCQQRRLLQPSPPWGIFRIGRRWGVIGDVLLMMVLLAVLIIMILVMAAIVAILVIAAVFWGERNWRILGSLYGFMIGQGARDRALKGRLVLSVDEMGGIDEDFLLAESVSNVDKKE
jgi:hypothetical protein